jgi:hypothetical protein
VIILPLNLLMQKWVKDQESNVKIKSQAEIFEMFASNPDLGADAAMESSYTSGLFDNIQTTSQQFSPYQGKAYSNEEIQDALLEYSPWIAFTRHNNTDELIETAASDIDGGQVIAWFQGRSELGQRALGARSILADPRIESNRRRINQDIKEREWYRPLAPSVLSEHAADWFTAASSISMNSNANILGPIITSGTVESPYMSMTALVRAEKRALVPAICHIDGSARLQTISSKPVPSSSDDAPSLYSKLITAFFKRSGVPMVLNTSFNRKGEPIVETPYQALRSFLACNGDLATLYLGQWQVKKRDYPIPSNATSDKLADYFSKLIVAANPLYLYEVTTSTVKPDQPLRIRIQTGDDTNQEDAWMTLPSTLHLEILQLLQTPTVSTKEDSNPSTISSNYMRPEEEIEYQGELTALDLIEALNSATTDDESEKLSAASFNAVVKDLYDRQLLYFENNLTDEDEMSIDYSGDES